MFKKIKHEADLASKKIAKEKGSCPDALECGIEERFSYKLAIAPTANISIIAGEASACIEPIPANVYTHKTLSGSFTIKNKYLARLLDKKEKNTDSVIQSIIEREGSVQHLDFLTQDEKDVFKTAFEIDQRWVIELAGDRAPFICQGQSINLFLPADIDKWDLLMLHWRAWERGVKSLYYCRSKSIQRAEFVGEKSDEKDSNFSSQKTDYEECLSCQ
jgi:ribonucleoside-diphosphate reductase alpha chain